MQKASFASRVENDSGPISATLARYVSRSDGLCAIPRKSILPFSSTKRDRLLAQAFWAVGASGAGIAGGETRDAQEIERKSPVKSQRFRFIEFLPESCRSFQSSVFS